MAPPVNHSNSIRAFPCRMLEYPNAAQPCRVPSYTVDTRLKDWTLLRFFVVL
jgi:hypothetical protein